MNCEDVNHQLDSGRADVLVSGESPVSEHLRSCEQCALAWHSAMMLRRLRGIPEPQPRRGFLEETLQLTRDHGRRRAGRPSSFGMHALIAIAATFGLAAILIPAAYRPSSSGTDPTAAVIAIPSFERPAEVAISLHETRAVTIAIDSVDSLANAQIRVALTGGIELEGMPGRRDIRWTTDIAAGVNRLALPVVALIDDDAEILVEVEHGQKRRRFVVPIEVIAEV